MKLINPPTLGCIAQVVCVAVRAFGLFPRRLTAQQNLTRPLSVAVADTPQRWAATPLFTKQIGVVITASTKTRFN
jgi:hypothetical protein